MVRRSAIALGSALLALASCTDSAEQDFGQRIVAADREPHNWLSTGRGYDETRYSPLDQIDTRTIGRLSLAWSHDLDTDRGQEATPIAVDGILYTTSAWSKVQAFDSVSGRLLWQFDPKVPGAAAVKACCDVVNRGAAYWDGKVYVGTIDGRLIALDGLSGRQLWSVQTTDPKSNNTITGAPRVVKGRVIIGNGGAELGARGYVTAYDAETGARAWRFYIVPGDPARPDGEISDKPLREIAQKSWSGKWWTREGGGGGGGTAWDSMAYDAELDLLFIGTGNASYWNKAVRSPGDGDNLFVGSVLALRPETGEYVWHYQETPGDQWDYTSTQHMILATVPVDGRPRKVIMHAPKNGYFYLIDRATGKLLSAKPYIPLNWSRGIDMKTGRPDIVPEARYDLTGKPWVAMPGGIGGHNWQPMSYSAQTRLVYLPVQEVPGMYKSDPGFVRRAVGTNIANDLNLLELPKDPASLAAALKVPKAYLLAWDPVRQRAVWRAPNPGIVNGGVLSTAGGLVFQGDNDGRFNAYDARSGRKLWTFDAQSAIMAAPVSFSVKGRQYVTVVVGFGGAVALVAGQGAWGKDGPRRNKSRVLTFALDAKGPPLPPLPPVSRPPILAPAAAGDARRIEAGRMLYLNSCVVCHGSGAKSAGVLPDLRRSSVIGDRDAFRAVVGDGILADRGMASFAENYDAGQIETIRAYLVARAREDAGGQ
jgi:quinohemoprotein ethanol dehydrogenase